MPSLTQPHVAHVPTATHHTAMHPVLVTHAPTPDPMDAYEVIVFPDGTILPQKEVFSLVGYVTRDEAALAYTVMVAARPWMA